MKIVKYILAVTVITVMSLGCKKEVFDDLSLLQSVNAPTNLSVLFEITQDNTGLVTITPNGEGAITYDVYYGDATTTPAKVTAGKSTQHIYAEGLYNVKIVGYDVAGKKTEITKQLTVTFRAPENLVINVTKDGTNNFKVNATATALYETNFKVFWGDVPNETGLSFNEGQTVSKTYAATGTYKVKITAYSGGAATKSDSVNVTITDPVVLPLDFQSATINYAAAISNFDGGDLTVINNSQVSGINTSTKVAKMVKNPGQHWGGSVIALGEPIDFSANKIFRMKVYSPRVGAKVLLKVENATNGAINFEKEVPTTKANQWEEIGFDFTAINTANSYHKIVLIFDLGTPGDGSANFTFLLDDIKLSNTMPVQLTIPVDFESSSLAYNFINFDGGNATVITNPHSNGINTSAKVGRMIKNAGQHWGGSVLELASPIDFSANKIFRMKVYSPRVGAKVLLKVENQNNGAINFEKEVATTTANTWEDLVFDYSAINTANSYQKIVLIFDLGTVGDGSANFTFYFDDIRLTNTLPLLLPLDFQSTTLTYAFQNFDGGSSTVENNPSATGINTSSKVGRMIKNAGQVWGGSWIGLDAPINFTSNIMKMKVYSPRVGAKVLLKIENQTNGALSYEKEVLTTTANAWEELTFDMSGRNTSNTYQKIVLIFDLGTMGDGTANFTYYFDDIRVN